MQGFYPLFLTRETVFEDESVLAIGILPAFVVSDVDAAFTRVLLALVVLSRSSARGLNGPFSWSERQRSPRPAFLALRLVLLKGQLPDMPSDVWERNTTDHIRLHIWPWVVPYVIVSRGVAITHPAALWPSSEKGATTPDYYLVLMYIAGLYSFIPSPQGVEGLAVLTTADFFRYLLWKSKTPKITTEGEGDPPVPESAPRSRLDKVVFSIQALAGLLPPTVYCTAVAFNNFKQPAWMLKFALPENVVQTEWKAIIRLIACAAAFSLKLSLDRTLSRSDERWRMIGRREKPGVIQTGPYAVVRHPVYSVMLLQQVFYSVMYWSYAPLASLGVLASVIAIKIPLEEKAAQEDDIIGNDYSEYMKRVSARVIPHVW